MATEALSLANTDLLAGLDERQAADVASLGRVRVFRAGSLLCRVGQLADSVFVVREGRVDVTAPLLVMGAPTPVRLESLCPGATLGWCAFVPPHGFTVDAVAATSVVVLAFRREPLLQLIAKRPEIGLTLVANAASAFARRNVRLQALWLREMQRDVNHLGGREARAWTRHSSS